jgi:hypothetical protein
VSPSFAEANKDENENNNRYLILSILMIAILDESTSRKHDLHPLLSVLFISTLAVSTVLSLG